MRASPAAWTWLVGMVLVGCGTKVVTPPTVTLTPSGTVQATGPVTFTATASGTGAPVTWSLAGPGSLSGTTGPQVVYRPPAAPGIGSSATLTATAGAASASATLSIGPAVLTPARIPGLTAPVQVLYDAWDVPHVRCAQAADCFAVQGWLHARDRLFEMDFVRRVAQGRLAELVGPLGLAQDVQLRTLFTTRAGARLPDALAAAMDPATRAVATAYASGVNAYLAALRASPSTPLPGEYAQLPYPIAAADIPDWTVSDVIAIARLQQFQLSETLGEETDYGRFAAVYGPGAPLQDLGKLNTWIRAAQPTGEQTHTLTGALPSPVLLAAAPLPASLAAWSGSLAAASGKLAALKETLKPLDGSRGSNNWVVDAAHSASGMAMVANDPHLSLQYPPNFYLATLTSSNPADGMDVTGGTFPGTPGAAVGRGQHVGWGVTVVGYDVTDLYLEQALPPATCAAISPPANTAFCVLFNGAPAAALAYPATYLVRVGPGAAGLVDAQSLPAAQRPPPVVVVVPQHGPIIQAPDAAGKAVSVRWTGQEDWTDDLRAFLKLDTAADVDAAMAAVEDWSSGAQNFVLADDAGHIAYYPHALVPVRNFADARVTAPAALKPPWFPLPGDGSAEWGTGVAADHCAGAGGVVPAAACWLPIPKTKDPAKGYLATANADPFGVSDDNNPLAHPPYLSFDWSDSTGFRHARITERLNALTTTGAGKVSLADMETLQADHKSRLGAHFTEYVASAAFDATAAGNADFAAARVLLEAWRADGYDCPSGLLGIDPVASLADPDPKVSTDSAACHLFHAFLRTLLQNVFSDDLAVAHVGLDSVAAVKGMLYMLDPATPSTEQAFCNDVDASGTVVATHSCAEQVVTALVTAFDTLDASLGAPGTGWAWGRVHTFQPVSLFPLVTLGYQPGPFARPGGAFTVDVGNPSISAKGPSFAFGSSGNVRHVSVMDAASPRVRMQLPGPERSVPYGVVAGPDLLGAWARNQYFDYATGGQIQASAVASQAFNP